MESIGFMAWCSDGAASRDAMLEAIKGLKSREGEDVAG
jgi:hypothetical protein